MDSFAALFEASLQGGDFGKEGEIVQGTVVAVQRDNVVIDIGGKSEGIIALEEWKDEGLEQVLPPDIHHESELRLNFSQVGIILIRPDSNINSGRFYVLQLIHYV